MTGQEAHARWLRARWPDMNAETIARDWELASDRAKTAWDAVAQPHQALAEAITELAGEMHAEVQAIAPGSEPDGMPDMAGQIRAEVLHETAGRILRLLENPVTAREIPDAHG